MGQNFELKQLLEESQSLAQKLREEKKKGFLNSLDRKKLEETLLFHENFFSFYFQEVEGY